MSDLMSLFNSSKDDFVDFSENETNVFVQIGSRTLSARKLVGQFPNYEAILPGDAMNSVILRSADLLASLQRVLEFADERSSAVKLQLGLVARGDVENRSASTGAPPSQSNPNTAS
jgi:DNA polymerase III subunit beta